MVFVALDHPDPIARLLFQDCDALLAEGLASSLAGSVVGSVLVFLAARRWGKELVVRLVGERTFRKYVGMLDAKGWWVFVVLLVPFVPDDAVAAPAGLSALKFRRFLAIMVVGRKPGSTTTALLASEWVTGSAALWITVGIVVAVILAPGFVYRERLETWVFHMDYASGYTARRDAMQATLHSQKAERKFCRHA